MKKLQDYIKEDVFDIDSKVIYAHDLIGTPIDNYSNYILKDIKGHSAIITSNNASSKRRLIIYSETIIPKLIEFGINEFIFDTHWDVHLCLPGELDELIKFKSKGTLTLGFGMGKIYDIKLSNIMFDAGRITLSKYFTHQEINIEFNNVTFQCDQLAIDNNKLIFHFNKNCKVNINNILFNWLNLPEYLVKNNPVYKKFREILNTEENKLKDSIEKLLGLENIYVKGGITISIDEKNYFIREKQHEIQGYNTHVIGNGWIIQWSKK